MTARETSRRALLAGAAAMPALALPIRTSDARTLPSYDFNIGAALKRLEHIVEVLQSRHVCEGWSIDQEAADRAIAYLRHLAEGGADDDNRYEDDVVRANPWTGFLTGT